MLVPNYELEIFQEGYDLVVGIDEAGRGAWAGPVAVGFYILQRHQVESLTFLPEKGMKDSKLMSAGNRQKLFNRLLPAGGFTLQPAQKIDEIGIGETIKLTISQILHQVSHQYPKKSIKFLIDGKFSSKFMHPTEQIIKGDQKVYAIAGASILAKHSRDQHMLHLHQVYPHYSFDKHKGYGTKIHSQTLSKYGPCPQHRRSFRPVAKFDVLG